MHNITSSQVFGAVLLAAIGYGFRLGIIYRSTKKAIPLPVVLFAAVFSFGAAALAFLLVVDSSWKMSWKIVTVCVASFVGNEVVPGLGNIKAQFFTEILKAMIRRWANTPAQQSEYDETTSEDTSPPDDNSGQ